LAQQRHSFYEDKEYARYVHSGEALAIAVLKGSDRCPWTKGLWLDIVDMDTFERKVPTVCQPRSYHDRVEKTCFNWIVAEPFPRKINPEYTKGDDDLNRYLTWKAANEDIANARKSGYHGKLHLVLVSLCDENKNANRKVRYLKPHRSERDGRWADAYGYLHGPLDGPKPKDIKVIDGPDPKWVYHVVAQIEITPKQLEAVKRKRYEIIEKIRADRGAKLSHFPLASPRKARKADSPKKSKNKPGKK